MKIFNIFKRNKPEKVEFKDKTMIAYSKFFKRYIVLDEYIDNNEWYFYLSDANGNKYYNRLKCVCKFNDLKWSSVKYGN